ncbi:MAG: MbcA/ParS/Xre antitoxin family protein [Gammaproteobacteria bacterium]|nr:MbcA/ParS/Xre antitoxin family protein [Gammaproteobacteria bacterium]
MARNASILQDAAPVSSSINNAETGAMLRAFFNLVKRWQLNDRQGRILLGEPATRTYARWKTGDVDQSRISRDIRERLSILMGIHKSLRYMFPEPSRAYGWLHKPNQAFGGGSALDRLLAGSISDLVAVRAYLDAERGGW